MKMVQSLWKTIWQFLIKSSIYLLCNPATVLLDVYPREVKHCVPTKPHIRMFIAALFVTTPNWKSNILQQMIKQIAIFKTPYNRILLAIKGNEKKKKNKRVPIMAQWLLTWLGSMGTQVCSPASLSGIRFWHCHEVWVTDLDPVLLCLWNGLEAAAPMRLLNWKPPHAGHAAQKSEKKVKCWCM